jgi:casein kinase 1
MGPTPVQIKPSRRTAQEPARPTDIRNASVQPLVSSSRRQSQHLPQPARDGSLTTPHPYANTSTPVAYRNGDGYGRITPLGQNGANSSNPALIPSDSYLYGQNKNAGADGTGSAAGPTTRVIGRYDGQIQGTDVDDGHGGKRRGFWSAFCCRG